MFAVGPSRVFWLDQSAFNALLASDLAARTRLASALEYRQQVADMPLFRDFSPAELDALLARMEPLTVDAGATDAVERTELLTLQARDFLDLLGSYLGRASELQRLSYLRLRTHKRLDEIV